MTSRSILVLALALAVAANLGLRAEERESAPLGAYAEVAAGALMPGGGSHLRRAALWSVRAGCNLAENWNAEGEYGQGRVNQLSARCLWRPLGYEQLDPFLSLGVAALGNASWAGGPEMGLGCYYYIGDHLALRGDLRMAFELDGEVMPVSSALFGVSWTF